MDVLAHIRIIKLHNNQSQKKKKNGQGSKKCKN